MPILDRRYARIAAAALLVVTALVATACAGGGTEFRATFVRYEAAPDDGRIAIVSRAGQEITARVEDSALSPGDPVTVRTVGRNWDDPQWWPENAIVSTR